MVKDMGSVVAAEGQAADWNAWSELSFKERLRYSLTTERRLSTGMDRKAKPAGALAWVQGMQQVDSDLAAANSVEGEPWGVSVRNEVLYQEMGRAVDHENAGAEEDLEQLVEGMDWLIAGL